MRRLISFAATLSAAVALLVATAAVDSADVKAAPALAGQEGGAVREFTVNGTHYAFQPQTIEVNRNDLVKISFTAQDIPHSFTVDEYRIVKRAGTGQTVTFEFRADRPGTFSYYCNLTQDEKCRNMKGRLVVK
jgi:heme/copper-type cytochrome/quinol oxidase subunit 2